MLYMFVRDPALPYLTKVEGGLPVGRRISIEGCVDSEAERFSVNLKCGPGRNDNIALHLDSQFSWYSSTDCIVRNSYTRSLGWGNKERRMSGQFPFKEGRQYKLEITCEHKSFRIHVDGKFFDFYNHRLNLSSITHLEILGSTKVSSIRISDEERDADEECDNQKILNVSGSEKGSTDADKMLGEPEDFKITEDVRMKVLQWAASFESGKECTPKMFFMKDIIRTCGPDECTNIRHMLQYRKRKLGVERGAGPSLGVGNPSVTVTVSDEGNSLNEGLKKVRFSPWWERYKNEDIVIFDTEHVHYMVGEHGVPHVATIDMIDGNGKLLFSEKVFHEKDSFEVNWHTGQINGYKTDTFANPNFKTEQEIRNKVMEILTNKLVVVCGGISDFIALDLKMASFDVFDLQMHWYADKRNENALKMRQVHSLRSLMQHYFKKDIQIGVHTSFDDAMYTLQLYNKYKEIKVKDMPKEVDSRWNNSRPYNEIDVIPPKWKKQRKGKKKCQGVSVVGMEWVP